MTTAYNVSHLLGVFVYLYPRPLVMYDWRNDSTIGSSRVRHNFSFRSQLS